MHSAFRVALLCAATTGFWSETAAARPVTLEPLSTFGTPDPAYDGFATDVAIDGDYALATASRSVEDPGGDPTLRQDFATAFMLHRNGTRWELVRRLEETQQIRTFPIPLAVAMQNGLAAVQTARTDIWKLTATGWVRQPAELSVDGPGNHLVVDGGRALSGDGTAPWNGRVFAPDATGTLDFALNRMAGVIEQLVVYADRMKANLDGLGGLVFSQRILLALTQKGMSREASYAAVQRNAMEAWRGNASFLALCRADTDIRQFLADDELVALFDMGYHTKHVDTIFKRVFG